MAKPDESMVKTNQQRRSGFFSFLAESVREMRRVRWPKRGEVVLYTAAALVMSVVLGLLVWGFDLGVSKLMSLVGVV
ncbi:preprotein translocase subunit SecE [Alicyclobacillus fodiniaquatilis]|jgi:preprotein translocase subunit SecE|uniref:Protein translocase subunit SecE n=1 Tax=Alicyclobacillus fodiniaquatilis TaxID=1661150 RepID=A0ABW4J9Z0_9BACL